MKLADIWRDVGSRIGVFTNETRQQIPDGPGVYAWFLPLWMFRNDLAELLQLLNRIQLYDPESLGDAHRSLVGRFRWHELRIALQRHPRERVSKRMNEAWAQMQTEPAARDAFQRMLMEASILMPPLYVGRSEDLGQRYQQHVDGTNDEANVFHRRFLDFTAAVGLKLTVADLLFATITLPPEVRSSPMSDDLNSLFEFVLMNLAMPPFSAR